MCLVTMLGHRRHTENGNLTMCQEVLPSAYVFHKFIFFFSYCQVLKSVTLKNIIPLSLFLKRIFLKRIHSSRLKEFNTIICSIPGSLCVGNCLESQPVPSAFTKGQCISAFRRFKPDTCYLGCDHQASEGDNTEVLFETNEV